MTEVEMIKPTFWGDVDHKPRSLRPGEIVQVPEEVAARWIRRGIAAAYAKQIPTKESEAPPDPPGGRKGRGSVPGALDLLNRTED